MQGNNRSRRWAMVTVLAFTVSVSVILLGRGQAESPKVDAAVERARREVRMLDDIYKTAVVLITQHYVDEKSSLAAGQAAKALFKAMNEKGWHEVRLLDAAGEPINDENLPRDGFEKKAVKALLDGKPYYDEVSKKDGKRFLLAATPIPVVLEKCIMCHENYKGKKLIGALGYTIPIQE